MSAHPFTTPSSVTGSEGVSHEDCYSLLILVTKRSGRSGGFAEKAEAARRAGIQMLVVERPCEEQGETMEEILNMLKGERTP